MKFFTIVALLAFFLALSYVSASESMDSMLNEEGLDMENEIEWVQPAFIEALPAKKPAPASKPAVAAKKPAVAAKSSKTAAASTANLSGSPCARPVTAKPATIQVPADIVKLAASKTLPPNSPRGVCGKGALTEAEVRTFLSAAWTAFGATPSQVTDYVNRNLKQAHRESTYCPNIVQGIIKGDPNNNNPAGGLFQFIPATFNHWAVRGFEQNRFNPLSNILAAVNAQVNSACVQPACHHRVLSGCAGWSPVKGSNPYQIPGTK